MPPLLCSQCCRLRRPRWDCRISLEPHGGEYPQYRASHLHRPASAPRSCSPRLRIHRTDSHCRLRYTCRWLQSLSLSRNQSWLQLRSLTNDGCHSRRLTSYRQTTSKARRARNRSLGLRMEDGNQWMEMEWLRILYKHESHRGRLTGIWKGPYINDKGHEYAQKWTWKSNYAIKYKKCLEIDAFVLPWTNGGYKPERVDLLHPYLRAMAGAMDLWTCWIGYKMRFAFGMKVINSRSMSINFWNARQSILPGSYRYRTWLRLSKNLIWLASRKRLHAFEIVRLSLPRTVRVPIMNSCASS